MQTDNFEKAFETFIDGKEYDIAEQAIFELVRCAFTAGWNAAKWQTIRILPPPEE